MAIQELYSDTGTSISTSEYSLTGDIASVQAQTVDAMIQAVIDFSAMQAGDSYEVKVYDKVYSAGSQKVIYGPATLTGPQITPLVTPGLIVMHGWDVTVKRLAGSDRSISWSIRSI